MSSSFEFANHFLKSKEYQRLKKNEFSFQDLIKAIKHKDQSQRFAVLKSLIEIKGLSKCEFDCKQMAIMLSKYFPVRDTKLAIQLLKTINLVGYYDSYELSNFWSHASIRNRKAIRRLFCQHWQKWIDFPSESSKKFLIVCLNGIWYDLKNAPLNSRYYFEFVNDLRDGMEVIYTKIRNCRLGIKIKFNFGTTFKWFNFSFRPGYYLNIKDYGKGEWIRIPDTIPQLHPW